jgi:syringomycin synthetase protein SyrE
VFLSRDRYARLTHFAKAQNSTANSLFLAAIYACFARNEGQWDLSIGLPTLNRRTARAKHTVGPFATMNALRCRYAPALGFGALMREIGADLRRGYRHQRYPLAELNRRLTLASSGRRQVYDISFSFETADYGTLADGSRVSSEAIVNREMLDPLAIFVRDYAGNRSVQIDLVHNLEYLDEAAMDLYAARFGALLDALPDCAETPLESLPVVPAEERRQVVVDFNAGPPRCSRPATVVEGFEAQVGRTPQLTVGFAAANRSASASASRVSPRPATTAVPPASSGPKSSKPAISKEGGVTANSRSPGRINPSSIDPARNWASAPCVMDTPLGLPVEPDV